MSNETETSICIPRLYYRYQYRDDESIRSLLAKVTLVKKQNKGVGSVYGYYPLSDEAVEKITAKPRNVSLTFDATETKAEPMSDLSEYKTITFLIKSSSRFFLKPDIGEVIDQIQMEDYYSDKIKAICVNLDNYECLEGTEGEHFLMTATLLTTAIKNQTIKPC